MSEFARPGGVRLFDYSIDFQTTGRAGDVVVISRKVEHLCHIRNKLATDSTNKPGTGTRVRSFKIAGKSIRAEASWPFLTKDFTDNPLFGGGINYGAIQQGSLLELEIEFLVDCTFSLMFFCKAVP